MLTALEGLDALPEQYRILEVSAELRERQESLLRSTIPHLVDRVHWLSGMPDKHSGIVVANEVVDAMPVERFVRRSELMQYRIIADDSGFSLMEAAAPEALVAAVDEIEADLGVALADGYVSEVSLGAPPWIGEVVATLQTGCIFLCDYGLSRREYYGPARNGGWLRCHFRHRAHNDPLILPGIQDITAWVDFSGVAAAALDAGAEVAGYTDQASFLLGGGLERELENLLTLSQTEQLELSAQAKMLTLPGEMGEHFKCIAFCKGPVAAPTAFRLADRTHTL
jgi:SAM-dependent MidA family methyltransferase